jgi:isopentenyl-diphosphate Delta-isomerase
VREITKLRGIRFLASAKAILYTSVRTVAKKKVQISSRKREHVAIALSRDVSFRTRSAGFEAWDFVHNALPECDVADIDPHAVFLNRTLSFPLIVSSMTGGYPDALKINRQLAEVCAEKRLAMGVGSQRQAIDSSAYHRTFSVVREVAPDIPVYGNLGAPEVGRLKDAAPVLRLLDMIRADGFAVHLNPLQEYLQPEGNPEFRGVLDGIAMLVRQLPVPVIVKEIGAGISAEVARRLVDVGVRIIDVAGAGGTSWAGVEILRRDAARNREQDPAEVFWDWGIATTDALRQVAALKQNVGDLTILGSGGINSGLSLAKAIAMGADAGAAARPLLKALSKGGQKALAVLIDGWKHQFVGAMFLTGSRSVKALQKQVLVHR